MNASCYKYVYVGSAVLCVFLGRNSARAEIKQFAFQGTVTAVENIGFVLNNSVTNGAALRGFYTFDSAVADSNPDPTVGDYWYTNGHFGIVVSIGDYVFRTDSGHVQFLMEVVNRPGQDNYLLRSYQNVCSKPIGVEHISWQLDDPTGGALTSDHLPVIPPALSAWQSTFGLNVVGGCGGSFFIRAVIQSIGETPVSMPEPPACVIAEAVEIKWQSQLGYYYQVQAAERRESWTNIGEPILGDGTVLSQFVPGHHGKKIRYRVEVLSPRE